MNDKLWIIEIPVKSNPPLEATEAQLTITCEICGVSQDGSLLCFNVDPQGQMTVVKGFAPGYWIQFTKSTLRTH